MLSIRICHAIAIKFFYHFLIEKDFGAFSRELSLLCNTLTHSLLCSLASAVYWNASMSSKLRSRFGGGRATRGSFSPLPTAPQWVAVPAPISYPAPLNAVALAASVTVSEASQLHKRRQWLTARRQSHVSRAAGLLEGAQFSSILGENEPPEDLTRDFVSVTFLYSFP